MAWQGATLVETLSDPALKSVMAMDGQGNVMAISQHIQGSQVNLLASRRTATGAWTTPVPVDTGSAPVDDAQLVMDASGNARAVWQQSNGSQTTMWSRSYLAASGWGPAQPNIPSGPLSFHSTHLAIGGNGSIALIGLNSSAGLPSMSLGVLYAPTIDVPGQWRSLTVVPGAGSNALFSSPKVALDANGNGTVIWLNGGKLWGSSFRVPNPLESPVYGTVRQLSPEGGIVDGPPQLTMSANGRALAVWLQKTGLTNNLWAREFLPAGEGNWASTAQLMASGALDSETAPSMFDVASDAGGNGMVVWLQSEALSFRRFNASQGWSEAQSIGLAGPGSPSAPQLVMDAQGHAIAAWEQQHNSVLSFWTSRQPAGGTWQAPTELRGPGGELLLGRLQLTGHASGRAGAVWIQRDVQGRNDVWSDQYAPPAATRASVSRARR
jgi:hypothetical protein